MKGVTASIHVQGVETALRGISGPQMHQAINVAVHVTSAEVERRMETYPPENEGNVPGPYPKHWYERLYGPRWANKDGSIGGIPRSEQLKYSWRDQAAGDLTHIIDTRSPKTGMAVSYGAYVHDADEQLEVHGRHGWPTAQKVATDIEDDPAVEAAVMREIDRVLV